MFSSRTQPVLTPEIKGRKGPNGRGLHRPPPHTSLPVPLHAIVPQDVAPSNLWQTWFLWSRKIIAQYMMRSNSRRQKAFSSSLSLSLTNTHIQWQECTHTQYANLQYPFGKTWDQRTYETSNWHHLNLALSDYSVRNIVSISVSVCRLSSGNRNFSYYLYCWCLLGTERHSNKKHELCNQTLLDMNPGYTVY